MVGECLSVLSGGIHLENLFLTTKKQPKVRKIRYIMRDDVEEEVPSGKDYCLTEAGNAPLRS